MALKRNERYPGRFDNPSAAHPQGAFKNRTSPTAKDGSYLEKDWANDWDGFMSSLLDAAAITPNGLVDEVGSSQYYSALLQVIAANPSIPSNIATSGVRGAYSNLAASAAGSNATVSITADSICLKNAANEQVVLNGVAVSIDLMSTGAGGMDSGAIPASSWVATYVIHNPTTNSTMGLASLSFTAPTLPSGYTHWAFVEAVRTNAGATQLLPFTMDNGMLYYSPTAGTSLPNDFFIALNAGTATSPTAISLQSIVPQSAKEAILGFTVTGSTGTTGYLVRGSAGIASGVLLQCINNGVATQRMQASVPRPFSNGVYYFLTNPGTASIQVMGWRS